MATTFNVAGAVAAFTATVKDVLTIAGDTVTALPEITATDQLAFDPDNLPMVVIQYGKAASEQQGCGQLLTVPITVHLIRSLEAGTGIAADTIMSRLSDIARRCVSDYRLLAVTVENAPVVETVEILDMALGNESETQAAINAADQQTSMAGGSLMVVVKWWEPWS